MATVVGHALFASPGEGIEAEGSWTEHSEYGERFIARTLKTTLPRQAHAAERYLASGLVKGVGEELARRMVARFGAEIFDIIEKAPELLRTVDGVGPARVESIRSAWQEQRALRRVMEILGAHGLSVSKAPRILKALGPDAAELIEKNPYRLAREVPGVGFKSADLIARHHGLSVDSEERFASALHDRLQAAVSRGHCAYPVDLLLRETARLVDAAETDLRSALESEIESGRFIEATLELGQGFSINSSRSSSHNSSLKGTDIDTVANLQGNYQENHQESDHENHRASRVCVFPAVLAAAESRLAAKLKQLSSGRPPWGSSAFLRSPPSPAQVRTATIAVPLRASSAQQNEASRAGSALSAPLPGKLSHKQTRALEELLNSKVSILTGGPGTGKTTLIRSVFERLTALGWNVVACAPTGRASQRLSEAAGVEAQTIHRLLGWDPSTHGFRHQAEFPLRVDLLVVDEASMIGLELMDSLVQALPDTAALMLVGDTDQLPSVQAGRVLDSLIESKRFTHMHLDEIFRQGDGSLIIRAARDVLEGQLPPIAAGGDPGREFHFIEARDAGSCIDKIIRLVRDRIPAHFGLDPLRDIQVLSPMNLGAVGARALNRALQEALNPTPLDQIERFGSRIAVGDKILVTANDYDKDVFNGDVGRVLQIERDRSSLRIDFGLRRIDFDLTDLDLLSLAYAITIHKSQGSEYGAVVIPLLEESAPLLSRNLLYTAMTRGRKLVVIVGSRRALMQAVRSQPHLERRWSGLARRLSFTAASDSINE